MIDLNKEKQNGLSAKDRYDILSFAIEAADDGGFVSSFVFERVLYVYAAIMLDEEHAETIRAAAIQDPILAWDILIKNGYLQSLLDKYKEELDILSEEAKEWFDEYVNYVTSARGVLSVVEQFSGDIIGQAANRLKETITETEVDNVISIADKWGMNNAPVKEEKVQEEEEKDKESLF